MVDTQGATPAEAGQAVITLPAEIDVTAARRLCGELGAALASGAVIAASIAGELDGPLPVYPSLGAALTAAPAG